MPLSKDELELAETLWIWTLNAPYWFIGIEERMAPSENDDRSNALPHFVS